MRKGWHSISKMILGCLLLLASVALAQEQPGNPEYSWLNGKWKGRSLSNAPFEMELRVMNDNEVKGSGVLQDRVEGNQGTIQGGGDRLQKEPIALRGQPVFAWPLTSRCPSHTCDGDCF